MKKSKVKNLNKNVKRFKKFLAKELQREYSTAQTYVVSFSNDTTRIELGMINSSTLKLMNIINTTDCPYETYENPFINDYTYGYYPYKNNVKLKKKPGVYPKLQKRDWKSNDYMIPIGSYLDTNAAVVFTAAAVLGKLNDRSQYFPTYKEILRFYKGGLKTTYEKEDERNVTIMNFSKNS